ncbi:MAG: NAD(P)-dependent oxidoreductase, partial [Hyphomonadaceae bacterium]
MRGLVIGGSGYLGARLVRALGPRGLATHRTPHAPDQVAFDAEKMRLSDLLPQLPGDLTHVFAPYGAINPEAIARDPARFAAINVAGMIGVLKDALDAGLKPVFFSTDYVFDGAHGGWTEEDAPRPLTAYGAQKLAVEAWLATVGAPWLTVRLSKLVSGDRDTHSVLGQWVNDFFEGRPQRCAADQIFSPTFVDDAAGAVVALCDAGAQGLFHVAAPEALSRLDLLNLLYDAAREHRDDLVIEITPCRLHDLNFAEKRPLNTALSSEKLRRTIDWR